MKHGCEFVLFSQKGVSKEAFRRHYQPVVSALNHDNVYGRLLFRLHARVKESPSVFRAHAHLAQKEQATAAARRPFNKVVWGMFTGSDTYGQLLRTALAPGFLLKLLWHTLREKLRRRQVESTPVVQKLPVDKTIV